MLLALLAAGPAHAQSDDRVLARIGPDSITVSEFERSYVTALLQTGQNDTPEHRWTHLEDFLRIHLLADEARRRGLDRDAAYERFAERARRQALASLFYETAFVASLPPLGDAEIRRAFARSKQQVILRHLYYRDEAAARAAHARLLGGRAFLEEARDCYGLAAIDSSAGYLGPVQYFQVDDAVAEAAFALDVGEISAPVRSRFGYHILRADDRLVNPIPTESEYQTRKAGLAAKLRQRHRRLHGDRFVRDFMESLSVEVEPEAVAALAEAIGALDAPATPHPIALTSEEAAPEEAPPLDPEALRDALREDTPLARYTFEGQAQTFTAGDYLFWLEDLPPTEARQRTAASVGRALRNEAFARAGRAHGLAEEAYVVREVERQVRIYLAQRLQAARRGGPLPAPDEVLPAPEVSVDTALFEEIMKLNR